MRRERRVSLLVVAMGSLLFLGQTGHALQGEGRRGRDQRDQASPERSLDAMTQALNLTGDQKNKIKPILEDREKQLAALRNDTSLSREQRFERIRTIQQQSQGRIREALSAEQQKKMEEMRERAAERRRGNREGMRGPEGTERRGDMERGGPRSESDSSDR